MYWLYFARDFYRSGRATSAASAPALAPVATPARAQARVATVIFRTPLSTQAAPATRNAESTPGAKAKPRAAKRQTEYVVRSAPVAPAAESDPLGAYLQRLSVDGEHAFGVWDEDAGFSAFSANFERITGLNTGECAGHDWIHHIHHDHQYAINEALLNALVGHDAQCLLEARPLREDAVTRWLMLDVKAPRGNSSRVMVLFRDLTEQKALELALEETRSALAVAERSRAAFLSSMSHELRTPLNAIMGFSEMMKSSVFGELGNPTYSEYAKHIHESGRALLGKINDLLEIASMDVGGLTLEEDQFDLNHMLAEAVQMHSHHAFARQQYIQLDCAHTLEIIGDRAKLLCAVSHLIANALRHSPVGGEIDVCVRVQGGEEVILSVHDAGEGISQAQLEVIRTALSADTAYFKIAAGGIGLGLSLTKELVARHGGHVMIDSVRHRGTVVAMRLPANRVVAGMPARKVRR
jgi:PAS domain S-box-containing protein